MAPGAAELRATLRALLPEQMDALCAQAERLSRQIADQAGLEIGLEWSDSFASSANDSEATAIMISALESCNLPYMPLDEPFRASEDFGRFGVSGKIAMFLLGAGKDTSMLHNPDYDFPDALIPIGASVLLTAARKLVG